MWAQKKSRPVKRIPGVQAIVVTDGAAVYQRPDFDAPVLAYLNYQTKVVVSKKVYKGVGGLGLFHRVRYAKGKLGYIADTDIRVPRSQVVEKELPREARLSKAWEDEEEEFMGQAPLYLTRYVGGALAMVQFSEKFSGRALSDNVLMYGLRMMGPGTLWDGPPIDFNFWFSMQKPGYYKKFTRETPGGFLLFGDLMPMLPMVDIDNWLVSYGLGLMWTYTRFQIPLDAGGGQSVKVDSTEFRIGGVVGIGVGRRIGSRYMIRADGKYYFEKTRYFGGLVSFQVRY